MEKATCIGRIWIDHDQRCRRRGAHEVALVTISAPVQAGERCLDGGVFELHLGVLERGAVGGDGGR